MGAPIPGFVCPKTAFAHAITFLQCRIQPVPHCIKKNQKQCFIELWGKQRNFPKWQVFSSFSLLCLCVFKLQYFKYGSIDYNVLHICTLFTFRIGITNPIGEKTCLIRYTFWRNFNIKLFSNSLYFWGSDPLINIFY